VTKGKRSHEPHYLVAFNGIHGRKREVLFFHIEYRIEIIKNHEKSDGGSHILLFFLAISNALVDFYINKRVGYKVVGMFGPRRRDSPCPVSLRFSTNLGEFLNYFFVYPFEDTRV
jgi:hypothetical protein